MLHIVKSQSRPAMVAFLAALAFVYPGPCRAQVCPVEIENVSPQAPGSGTGAANVLRITYRNTSRFPVRGVEFGVQAVDWNSGAGRSGKFFAFLLLEPNAAGAALWNAARFGRKNALGPSLVFWPAIVTMGDGSRWSGSAAQCGYSTDNGGGSVADRRSAGAATATAAPAPNPAYAEGEREEFIRSGKASIVSVTSDPPGANIDVDGKLIGKTPLSFVLLATANGSTRNIMVYKDGYTLAGRDVTPNGAPITLNEMLMASTTR